MHLLRFRCTSLNDCTFKLWGQFFSSLNDHVNKSQNVVLFAFQMGKKIFGKKSCCYGALIRWLGGSTTYFPVNTILGIMVIIILPKLYSGSILRILNLNIQIKKFKDYLKCKYIHGLGLWNGYQWQQQIHILEECCGYVDTVHDD